MKDFMGLDGFSWFVGVVEDRNDPCQLGRVRVRVLGRHSENLTEVSTKDLPWAHVMHPVTDPSMQGLGHTPSFLTQGSWVVGFFRDNERQQPIIMGSLPGVPTSVADGTKGFNDPRAATVDGSLGTHSASLAVGVHGSPYTSKHGPTYGPYPGNPINQGGYGSKRKTSGHSIGEPDTNRLGRGAISETHQSIIDRREQRLAKSNTSLFGNDTGSAIPIATKPYLSTVSLTAEQETRSYWEEPHPKGVTAKSHPYISAAYPYNHVFESESGHITEVDDSPGAERLFRQHRSGTFEEIHANGSVVTKIIGDNYEIILNDENIVIKGSQNITIEGSVRELIKGDYIQEIEGDFYQKIHKNHRVKVGAADDTHPNGPGGNREEEIAGKHGYNINSDVNGRIGGDAYITSEKSKWELIGGQYTLSTSGKIMDSNPLGSGIFIKTLKDCFLMVESNLSISTTSLLSTLSVKSGGSLNVRSVLGMIIQAETTMSKISGTTMSQLSGSSMLQTAGTTYAATSTGNMSLTALRIDLNL